MPHQCTKCSHVYPDASRELLTGCVCGSKFFYYIRQEKFDQLKSEVHSVMAELSKSDTAQIEKDIRELTGISDPLDPVILDLESVRVLTPGKFEIDIVNLFNRNRPLIYKLGEGKYIIDLESSLSGGKKKRTGFIDAMRQDDIERRALRKAEREREANEKISDSASNETTDEEYLDLTQEDEKELE